MKSATKLWLITAAALILLGGILFGGALTMIGWNFSELSTQRYETREHAITEEFQSISIQADTAKICVVPSEGAACRVVCREPVNAGHTVTVTGGTLRIELADTRKWYEHIGINFQTPEITLYMPAGQYAALCVQSHTGDVEVAPDFCFERVDVALSTGNVTHRAPTTGRLKIRTSTGDIALQGVSADAIDLAVTTGKITLADIQCRGDVQITVSTGKAFLTDVTCQGLVSSGNTGDLTMTRVVGTGTFSIERTTGNVTFDACDAANLTVTTNTGDVKGTLLSDKVFLVDTNTGRRDVPQTTTGGQCTIRTTTGDVLIQIQ